MRGANRPVGKKIKSELRKFSLNKSASYGSRGRKETLLVTREKRSIGKSIDVREGEGKGSRRRLL